MTKSKSIENEKGG